jgi:hypothetical protein
MSMASATYRADQHHRTPMRELQIGLKFAF